MRAKEFISEVFQPGKVWQWEFRGQEEAFASFIVGEVEYLWSARIMNKRNPHDWVVAFQVREKGDWDKTFGITGTGNSAEVMSTVVDITRTFLQEYGNRVLEMKFSSGEDSRTSLYARMVKRLLPTWNLHTKRVAGETDFYLTNPVAYENLEEAPLADYVPLGFDSKGKQFNPVDKRLVQHPVNQTKAMKFFENTPYDFRLFFNNNPGLRNYRESGARSPAEIQQIFGADAEQILSNSETAITVVFIGNFGDKAVMMTPWIMAHRLGHAIQASNRQQHDMSSPWSQAENYLFKTINSILKTYYGKSSQNSVRNMHMDYSLAKEYSALFNALGTQRSSREGQITRPYEFMYEAFAQYLKDGVVTLNSIPARVEYGRKAWGRSTQGMSLSPEMRDDEMYRDQISEELAHGLSSYFSAVLKNCVGKVFVM